LIAHARAGGHTWQTSTTIGPQPKALRRAGIERGDGTSGLRWGIDDQANSDPIAHPAGPPAHGGAEPYG